VKSYRTITHSSSGLYREKGSKFLAYATPIADREAFAEFAAGLRKEHPKARHHCFAYRLGYDGEDYRASDDGEPSGTAGKPILGRMISLDLTYVAIIVVRYFGGKLLGAAGLVRAYKLAAEDALAAATIKEIPITVDYTIACDYGHVGKLEEAMARNNIFIKSRSFAGTPIFTVGLPLGAEKAMINLILSQTLNLPSEQIGDETEWDGLVIRPTSP